MMLYRGGDLEIELERSVWGNYFDEWLRWVVMEDIIFMSFFYL